jgi:hypothetical protein
MLLYMNIYLWYVISFPFLVYQQISKPNQPPIKSLSKGIHLKEFSPILLPLFVGYLSL